MKKLFAVALAALMLVSVFAFASCGNTPAEPSDSASDGTVASDAPETDAPATGALSSVEVIPVPEYVGTAWNYVGGMTDGVELEDDEIAATLEAVGGQIVYFFDTAESVSLITTSSVNIGTVTVSENNITFTFPGEETRPVMFTMVNNEVVMMVMTDLNNASYFTQTTGE